MRRLSAAVRVLFAVVVLFAALFAAAGSADGKVSGRAGLILLLRQDPRVGDTVLYAVNPDGSDLHRVIPGPVTATECPHWSPTGSLIAACTAGGTTIINPDTGALHVLPSPDPTLNIVCPVWSSDGTRLACGNFDIAANPARDGLYTVRSADGQGLRRLTSNPGGIDEPGDYSPDGNQIVFLRTDPTRPATANQAHFVVNVDGSGLHRISPWSSSSDSNGQSDGSWSPNGKLILFGNRHHLFTVHPDGTGLTEIPLATTGLAFPFAPVWSPTGTRILFGLFTRTTPGSGVEGVYTANPNGTDIRPVNASPTNSPTFQFEEPGDWGSHPLAR